MKPTNKITIMKQQEYSGILFAFVSHLIQSNAFESNASANANADESNANASANAAITGESNASANAAFVLAFANASAFEQKPGVSICSLNDSLLGVLVFGCIARCNYDPGKLGGSTPALLYTL